MQSPDRRAFSPLLGSPPQASTLWQIQTGSMTSRRQLQKRDSKLDAICSVRLHVPDVHVHCQSTPCSFSVFKAAAQCSSIARSALARFGLWTWILSISLGSCHAVRIPRVSNVRIDSVLGTLADPGQNVCQASLEPATPKNYPLTASGCTLCLKS